MLASRQRPPEWTWGRIKGVSMQRSTTNGMGLAGFILSLVGLFSAGCLSPIALVFSLIGLAKEPRGFAIAGLVISLVSLLGWVIGFAIFGVAFVGLLAGAVGLAALAGPVQAEFDVITDQLNRVDVEHDVADLAHRLQVLGRDVDAELAHHVVELAHHARHVAVEVQDAVRAVVAAPRCAHAAMIDRADRRWARSPRRWSRRC
jgi:hypothetical protein